MVFLVSLAFVSSFVCVYASTDWTMYQKDYVNSGVADSNAPDGELLWTRARILALEVGKYNITANSICPGNPGGERNVEVLKDVAEYTGKPFDENATRSRFKEMREKGVMGGMYLGGEGYIEALISHEDVARLALFLASDDASNITGQDINVSAGTTMW